MALEHVLLISLSEQPASGVELVRRFDRSIGYFWAATHQQIYKVLGRMEASSWVESTIVPQLDRPATKEYRVTADGSAALRRWLATASPVEHFRSNLAARLRGASFGDRAAVLASFREQLRFHSARLADYEAIRAREYPDPRVLAPEELDLYLVLLGGIGLEQYWVDWMTECLSAHGASLD